MSLDLWIEADLGGPTRARIEGYEWNYTHNVNPMWRELFNGQSLGEYLENKTLTETAGDLRLAHATMNELMDHFASMNPSNGWGSAEGAHHMLGHLVHWVDEHPNGLWGVSR